MKGFAEPPGQMFLGISYFIRLFAIIDEIFFQFLKKSVFFYSFPIFGFFKKSEAGNQTELSRPKH